MPSESASVPEMTWKVEEKGGGEGIALGVGDAQGEQHAVAARRERGGGLEGRSLAEGAAAIRGGQQGNGQAHIVIGHQGT